MDFVEFGSPIHAIEPAFLEREILDCEVKFRSDVNTWPLHFLKKFRASRKFSDLRMAIQSTHRQTELQNKLFTIYSAAFQHAHASSVRSFRAAIGQPKLLVLHLSCHERIGLAAESVASFKSVSDYVRHVVVVGCPDREDEYGFSPRGNILTVPATDAYEGLSQKISLAFRFLGICGNTIPVMKIDDDIRWNASGSELGNVISLTLQHHYMGRVVDAAKNGVYRWWHFGRYKSDANNFQPYGLIAACRYAEGGFGYFVSPTAINVLARASICFSQSFDAELSYEDIAVGKVLNSCGLYPHPFDAVAEGLLTAKTKTSTPMRTVDIVGAPGQTNSRGFENG